MKAVILAAGQARRLYPLTQDVPKTLLRVNGVTILERQVAALRAEGIKDITVVVGHHGEKVREALGRAVSYIRNPYFAATADIVSLWCARRRFHGPFVYLHGDVVFAPVVLRRLLADEPAAVRLAIERKPCDAEDEKVRIRDGRVIEIAKSLPVESADGEFVGLARVSAAAAPALREALEALIDEGELETQCVGAVQRLIDRGTEVHVTCVDGLPWCEVDFPEDLEHANVYASSFD